MKKKDKDQHPRDPNSDRDVVRDWQTLFARLEDVIDWALDIAVKLSREYPDDIDSIENVRTCVRAWLEGRPTEMRLTDVLRTLATIFAAIELDLGIDSITLLGPIQTFLESPASLPAVLRFPGVAHDNKPTVTIRRCPGRRNASAAFTQFAA